MAGKTLLQWLLNPPSMEKGNLQLFNEYSKTKPGLQMQKWKR